MRCIGFSAIVLLLICPGCLSFNIGGFRRIVCGLAFGLVLLRCCLPSRTPCNASKIACVAFSPSRVYSRRGCGVSCVCVVFSLVPWLLVCDTKHPTHPYFLGVFNFAVLPHPSEIRIIVKQSYDSIRRNMLSVNIGNEYIA